MMLTNDDYLGMFRAKELKEKRREKLALTLRNMRADFVKDFADVLGMRITAIAAGLWIGIIAYEILLRIGE